MLFVFFFLFFSFLKKTNNNNNNNNNGSGAPGGVKNEISNYQLPRLRDEEKVTHKQNVVGKMLKYWT